MPRGALWDLLGAGIRGRLFSTPEAAFNAMYSLSAQEAAAQRARREAQMQGGGFEMGEGAISSILGMAQSGASPQAVASRLGAYAQLQSGNIGGALNTLYPRGERSILAGSGTSGSGTSLPADEIPQLSLFIEDLGKRYGEADVRRMVHREYAKQNSPAVLSARQEEIDSLITEVLDTLPWRQGRSQGATGTVTTRRPMGPYG